MAKTGIVIAPKARDVNNTKWMYKKGWDFSNDEARVDVVKWIEDAEDRNSPLKILDVGCATGKTLQYLKKVFPKAELTGVEPDTGLSKKAGKFTNREVYNLDVEEFIKCGEEDHLGEYFDYILFNDVLEHLLEPWQVLKDARRFLKDGGTVLASIPNFTFGSVLFNILVAGTFGYVAEDIVNKGHIRFFTLFDCIRMFAAAGYKNIFYAKNMVAYDKKKFAGIIKEFVKLLKKTFGENNDYETYQFIMKADK